MGVGREEKKRKGRKEKMRRRLQGIGTMCKIVDYLGHVFDAEKGKVMSDSGIGGLM